MRTVTVAAVMCVAWAAGGGPAAAAGVAAPVAASGQGQNWQTFHLGPRLQGYAANSSVTTANASQLGVKWAADLYGAAVDSPVIAYDAALKERLAYVGTQNGDLVAVNLTNGQIAWSVWLGDQIRATPVVTRGAVFAATFNSSRIYKVNATTGTVECSAASPEQIEGSPVAATPPGGVPTVYFGANDSNTASGPLLAIKVSDCSVEWSFTGYASTTGSWDPLSYSVDATGEPLILFGTSDPDSEIYAIDAVTGKEVWRYAVYNPAPHTFDVGGGVVITPPKANGFAGGVAYVESKYGIMYALNLTTGARIWDVNYNTLAKSYGRNISTAARAGHNLVLGDANGLVDLNPVTGKLLWSNHNPADTGVDSSPAIAGKLSEAVVAVGDLAGGFDVDSLTTGAALYHYQTGSFITGSPAVSGGDILICSADGFLYDFAVGGGNETTLPGSTVTSPADSSTVANPDGDLTVSGTATDQAGVAGVVVAVQAGGPDGQWWDAATGQWVSGPVGNPASVASPAATSSDWAFSYPVPASGGAYRATAYTVSAGGQSGIRAATSGFTVRPSTTNPQLSAVPKFVPPGGKLRLAGTSFGDSETVAITLGGKALATATTTAAGAWQATVTVPASSPFGLTSVTGTGQSSGDTATAGVTVANKWTQFGYDSGHDGYEPNDPLIYDSIAAGNGTYLNPAWSYQSAAAVTAAPAVANNVAYDADADGNLTAVDVHNGAPLWTWTLSSKAALTGAPAVDPAASLVFVGSADGKLAAISTTTGKVAWSAKVGGQVSAPVFGSGHVYVTSSTGTVAEFGEQNGKKLWSKTLPQPIPTPPGLDNASKTLVVGESNGVIQALSATTGAGKWTHHVGAAPVTPATIDNGEVYVGAGDAVHALSEKTGVQAWSYRTGGKIGSSLALSSSNHGLLLVLGSADHHGYAIETAKGTLLWKTGYGGPVTGVAIAFASAVFTTSNGKLAASRLGSGERLWEYSAGAGVLTPPAVVDGAVYAGGQNADLYAFTSDGQQPS